MKKIGTKTLETDRLVLRKFHIDDAEEVFANYGNDDEVTKYLRWPTYQNSEAVRSYLSSIIASYDDLNSYDWAIELNATGEVIGNISVVEMQANRNQVEVGYVLSRKYWGQGLMSEALKKVINFFIDEVKVNKVVVECDTRNTKSIRDAEKADMSFVKTIENGGKNNQGICDIIQFVVEKPKAKKD